MKNLILLLTHNSLYLHSSAGSDWDISEFSISIFRVFFPLTFLWMRTIVRKLGSGAAAGQDYRCLELCMRHRRKEEQKQRRDERGASCEEGNFWWSSLPKLLDRTSCEDGIHLENHSFDLNCTSFKVKTSFRDTGIQISRSMDQTRCTQGSNEEWTFQKRN